MNFCFHIQVGFFIVTVILCDFLYRVNEICSRHTVRTQRLLHVNWVYVKCHSTTHSPQPQRTPRSSVDPAPNDIAALTLIPQRYPATTTQRCDTLRKASKTIRSTANFNWKLQLLIDLVRLYCMLTLDIVTYLFCVWLCKKLSPCHQPLMWYVDIRYSDVFILCLVM
jgi:hypothetical protein